MQLSVAMYVIGSLIFYNQNDKHVILTILFLQCIHRAQSYVYG